MPITTDGLKWVNQSLFGTWGKPSHLTVTDGTTMAHSKFTVVEISASGTTAKLRAEFGPDLGNFAWNKWSVTNGQASGLIKLNEVIQNNGVKLQGQTWTLTVELKFNTVVRRIFEGFLPYTVSHTLRGSTEYSSLEGVTYQNLFDVSTLVKPDGVTVSNGVITQPMSNKTNLIQYKKADVRDNTKYTVIFNVIENTLVKPIAYRIIRPESYGPHVNLPSDFTTGIFKATFTTNKATATKWDEAYSNLYCTSANPTGTIKFTVMILEGDYTNKPTPSYFEGIKSVSEEEANKLGIKSTGKNLFDKNRVMQGSVRGAKEEIIPTGIRVHNDTTQEWSYISKFFDVQPNTNYYINFDIIGSTTGAYVAIRLLDGTTVTNLEVTPRYFNSGDNTSFILSLYCTTQSPTTGSKSIEYTNLSITEGTTKPTYSDYKEDKKEIQLSEPLRGFPTGVKDKIQQRDDGVYLTKRVGKTLLDHDISWWNGETDGTYFKAAAKNYPIDINHKRTTENFLCDNFRVELDSAGNVNQTEYIARNETPDFSIVIQILSSKITPNNIDGLKTWLQSNPTTIYYDLETPIETKLPVGTNINLETYDEVTNFFSENKVTPLYSTVALVSN